MLKLLSIAALGLALVAPPVSAASPIAEIVCAPRAEMVQRLQQQMGERRVASGLRGPEEVMEIWSSEHGDWTLVLTYAAGHSCIVAMGEHFMPALPIDPA